jgi:hypothetical protein
MQDLMAVDADHVLAVLTGCGGYGVARVTSKDAAGHLDVGPSATSTPGIAEERVIVDVNPGGSALDLRQAGGHVTQQCDGDRLIVGVPGPRALAVAAAFP